MAIKDTFLPVYYNISISSAGLGGAAPDDGFIDHTEPAQYAATSAFPSTEALSLAKERANIRYEEIIRQLSTTSSPLAVLERTATGATEDVAANPYSLTIKYDREEFIATEDENNPGTILTGTDAVTRFVARALITDVTVNRDFYNPTLVGGVVQGMMIQQIVAGAIAGNLAAAEANITTIEVDLTT